MSNPLARLASLDLVRTFVAVGRRMSITQAAQDLHLTQSAVSRQVQALEEALGVQLLNRGYRSIAFTPAGVQLFGTADSAVQQLQDGLAAVMHGQERSPVTITASIGVTALWLLPRLGAFQQSHPGIDIRLAANNKLLDLKAEGADLAIRYCAPHNAPAASTRLFGEAVVPVGHPTLAARGLPMAALIAEQVLLELDYPHRPWLQWPEWLKVSGLAAAKPKGMLRFNHYDQVIQAALAGQGIALGRMALVEPLLRDGRLALLDPGQAERVDDYAYWLILAERHPRDDVRVVVDWIREEAALSAAPDKQ